MRAYAVTEDHFRGLNGRVQPNMDIHTRLPTLSLHHQRILHNTKLIEYRTTA